MSQQLFNVGVGLIDQNDVSYLSGSGAPSGTGVYEEESAVGSYYRDITTGDLYTKVSDSSPGQAADWIKFSPEELVYIRQFIGKAGEGSEWPSYGSPSPFHLTEGTGNDLVDGLVDLDSALGDNTWSANNRSNSPTIFELDPSQSIHFNLEIIDDAIGSDADMTSQNYIDPDVSIYSNLSALDNAIAAGAVTQSSVDNITTVTVIDSVNVDSVVAAKWLVTAISDTLGSRKQAAEVYAIHNGVAGGADATTVDYNVYSILTVGTAITGLSVTVGLSGAGASQIMELRVTSTEQVDVRAARIQVNYV